ncbi:zinc-finger homeodomain protein 1-like isoform X2 [Typha latifolia]|uniref:zinc-finger homeodomain protein 1-like isoform X2 n=1 Tax=Typha latifolia TaxID=4733 RepID=UPI003C2AC271
MDFDDHDDAEEEEEEEEEEVAVAGVMPVASAYEATPTAKLGGSVGVLEGAATSANRKPSGGGARYRECLKNHAVGIGGHAVDGCGEFIAAGEDGTLDALRCAACGCHRNFHRREGSELSAAAVGGCGGPAYQHHFSPYYRTPAAYVQPLPQHARPAPPLALPSTSGGGDDVATGSGKKRYRTKFSQEQKDKMLAFAEKVGWRIQKHDEAAVQQFCEEVGVQRHVLKVWMHNNKHTLGAL